VKPNSGDLVSVSAPREPKPIPVSHYTLSVSVRVTPEIGMAVGQISALSVVRDVIVRRIDRSPVGVAPGVTVDELVLVCAVTCVAVGGTGHVSTGGLMDPNVGVQHEWARSEKALVGVVKRCLPCEGRGPPSEWFRLDLGDSQELNPGSNAVKFTLNG